MLNILPQVVLCFSPVGSTLRVRSRKFPAIVNCTCIDWFHEWPEEALISVSSRFLSDVELISVSLLHTKGIDLFFICSSVSSSFSYLYFRLRYVSLSVVLWHLFMVL